MSERYPARVNMRLSQETFEAYKGAAEVLGSDVTTLLRRCIDEAVPAMQALTQGVASIKAGRSGAGLKLLEAMSDLVAANAEVSRTQVEALREEVESKVGPAGMT